MRKCFDIELQNGYKLSVEQNADPNFSHEIFVGIEDSKGLWHQDLAVVRAGRDGMGIDKTTDSFEVLVYADANCQDYTHRFSIDLYSESDS